MSHCKLYQYSFNTPIPAKDYVDDGTFDLSEFGDGWETEKGEDEDNPHIRLREVLPPSMFKPTASPSKFIFMGIDGKIIDEWKKKLQTLASQCGDKPRRIETDAFLLKEATEDILGYNDIFARYDAKYGHTSFPETSTGFIELLAYQEPGTEIHFGAVLDIHY